MLLLLASYANGCRRKRCAATGARLPHFLPEPAWFTTRLKEAGLRELLTRLPRAQHYSAAADVHEARIEAAVLVQPGEIYSGPLTKWGQEAHFLWNYYGHPCASYSLRIVDWFRLTTPAIVSTARGYQGSLNLRHFCFQTNVAPVQEDTRLHKPSRPQDPRQLGDIMDLWDLEVLRGFLADVPVLFLPECVLELICKGQWATLVLHADSNHRSTRKVNIEALKFMNSILAWPSAASFTGICRQIGATAPPPTGVSLLTEQMGQTLLDHVRHLEEGADAQALEAAVQALQCYVDAFAKAGPQSRASNAKSPAEDLIKSVSAAQSVRNRSKMAELQESLLTKFTPGELTDAVRHVVGKASSGGTISKNQVSWS